MECVFFALIGSLVRGLDEIVRIGLLDVRKAPRLIREGILRPVDAPLGLFDESSDLFCW
jgi:hypothetical protein